MVWIRHCKVLLKCYVNDYQFKTIHMKINYKIVRETLNYKLIFNDVNLKHVIKNKNNVWYKYSNHIGLTSKCELHKKSLNVQEQLRFVSC